MINQTTHHPNLGVPLITKLRSCAEGNNKNTLMRYNKDKYNNIFTVVTLGH